MKLSFRIRGLTLITGIALAALAGAQEPDKPKAATSARPAVITQGMPVFVQNIAPAAVAAVQVVDMFSAAVKAARLDEAKELLDPAVLILESGGSERSRDEYMAGHASADAAFLHDATQQLRYRQAQAEGNFAWVATESMLHGEESGKKFSVRSTETMLLKRTKAGWRIVHIHWSSRPAEKG